MTLKEKIIDYVRLILHKFQRTTTNSLEINETMNRLDTITKNQIWYRGEPYEIKQMYQQGSDFFGSQSFWIKGANSRKIAMRHYPLPQVIVDTLTSICSNDIQEVAISDEYLDDILQKILKDSNYVEFIEENIKEQLMVGDCGVYPKFHKSGKITWEIVKSEECEYSETMEEWYVKNIYQKNNKNFCLVTTFGKGYVRYNLFTEGGVEIPLTELEKTKDLIDIEFTKDGEIDEDLCLFVLFKSFCSPKFRNRGKAIYEGRDGAFDFVDEVYSTWGNANRKSTPKTFIDKSMLKKDKYGNVIDYNDYDTDIISFGGQMMGENSNGINTYNPTFPSNDYYQTFNMTIQSALVQILSPTTAGIDMRTYQTNVNTSYSNEIEKISIQTHNKILNNFADSLTKLIIATFKCYSYLTNQEIDIDELEDNIVIKFNDFSSPSDDKIIPLFSQAITAGFMSVEEALREWHVDWTEQMIQDELKRIQSDKETYEDASLWGTNDEMVEDTNQDEEQEEVKEEVKEEVQE